MAWAIWGLRDRLLLDRDVWLCHQCTDCSVRCPRGSRPGDLLAAIRRQNVLHYAAPRFLARWVSQPKYLPLLLGLPAALLGAGLVARERIESALGVTPPGGEPIVYSYSRLFPHWLINGLFLFFGVLAIVAAVVGVRRYWRAIDGASPARPPAAPRTTILRSMWTVLKSIATHDQFTPCTTRQTRAVSHLCLVFGFVALTVVTSWVITGPINPLLQDGFVYPFNFWSPWKLLANVGGLAMLGGAVLMIYERFEHRDETGWSTYFDWSFLWTVFIVVLTGFATEVLHYLRMVPHRHVVYFVHLVFVFALLVYLPYSKFAHLLYRTTAMVHAEYTGRRGEGTNGGDRETAPRTPPEPMSGARS